jgi:MurNAc alpha-1-phosphate uridylyltransferase
MTSLGDGSQWDVRIQYSEEGEPPLETAGGIVKALPLLGEDPFVVMSGDIWTNYDLTELLSKSSQVRFAHLVMVKNPDYHPDGDYGLLPNGQLIACDDNRYTYGSFGLYHPDLFKDLPVERLGLGKLFREKLDTGFITGELFEGKWFNIGTPEDLILAQDELKEML